MPSDPGFYPTEYELALDIKIIVEHSADLYSKSWFEQVYAYDKDRKRFHCYKNPLSMVTPLQAAQQACDSYHNSFAAQQTSWRLVMIRRLTNIEHRIKKGMSRQRANAIQKRDAVKNAIEVRYNIDDSFPRLSSDIAILIVTGIPEVYLCDSSR